MITNPNKLNPKLLSEVSGFRWSPNRYFDPHSEKYNIHFFDKDILPTWLDPITSLSLMRRGITPPNMLPTLFEDNIHEKIQEWVDLNYFKLQNGGMQHLGLEMNNQKPSEYDTAKVRVLIVRLTEYDVVDGSLSHLIVSEWLRTYCSESIFIDYAYAPAISDLPKYLRDGIPLLFGSITKRPPLDFDFIAISHSFPPERLALPLLFLRSGIPLFLWERLSDKLPYATMKGRSHFPVVFIGGIGSQMMESFIGDHPIYGSGMCSPVDHVLVGEGENLDLGYIESYINIVLRDKGTLAEWRKSLYDQRKHPGVYDPTRVYYEYADKLHIESDSTGKELSRTLWRQGGRIKATYMLDNEGNRVKVAGEGVKESQDLMAIQPKFLELLSKVSSGEDTLTPYLKDPNIQNE